MLLGLGIVQECANSHNASGRLGHHVICVIRKNGSTCWNETHLPHGVLSTNKQLGIARRDQNLVKLCIARRFELV